MTKAYTTYSSTLLKLVASFRASLRFLNVQVAEEKALLEAKVQELQLEWYLVLGRTPVASGVPLGFWRMGLDKVL